MAQKNGSRLSASASSIGKIKELNERYALTIGDIAAVLDVAPKTISRWTKTRKNSEVISEQKADSLEILESILSLGKEVLGSEDELNRWLHSHVFALDGNKPVDLIKTESGRRRVEEVLHQIEHGIF
ncbi:MAG TPA: MbcA/ParS/Xre antitoxin family protein [Ignavibacteriaceae bacterium]|nr:MbcA/ParS/Xre antitoxin family protein [Ignavibacteriaceae bacterium]